MKAKTTDRCMSAVINHLKREESVAHAPLCDHEDFNQMLFYKKTKEIIVRDPSENEWIMSAKGNRIVVSSEKMLCCYVILKPLRFHLNVYFQFAKAESNPKASKWDIDFLTGRLVNEGRDSWICL